MAATKLGPKSHQAHEDAQPQDPVDDAGHAREVGDVDLEEAREPRLGDVLLEVDGRPDADRDGERHHAQDHDERADEGGSESGGHRVARRDPLEEPRVEPRVEQQPLPRHQRGLEVGSLAEPRQQVDQFDRSVAHVRDHPAERPLVGVEHELDAVAREEAAALLGVAQGGLDGGRLEPLRLELEPHDLVAAQRGRPPRERLGAVRRRDDLPREQVGDHAAEERREERHREQRRGPRWSRRTRGRRCAGGRDRASRPRRRSSRRGRWCVRGSPLTRTAPRSGARRPGRSG